MIPPSLSRDPLRPEGAVKTAIILLSGGLDSATAGAIARCQGFRLLAMSFDYGQRHRFELESARKVAAHLGVAEHRIVKIDLRAFGGSALTDDAIDVPRSSCAEAVGSDGSIPITYVPARNTIFLSFALGWAEVAQADDIFIGVSAIDYSGYPDCRPEFIEAFERLANLATARAVQGRGRMNIHAPLIVLDKAQTIRRGLELGMDFSLTHSCYDPDAEGRACGRCDSCLLRKKGFEEAGVKDPTKYAMPIELK